MMRLRHSLVLALAVCLRTGASWAAEYGDPDQSGDRAFIANGGLVNWGDGSRILGLAPKSSQNPRLREWFARLERLAASPGTATKLMLMKLPRGNSPFTLNSGGAVWYSTTIKAAKKRRDVSGAIFCLCVRGHLLCIKLCFKRQSLRFRQSIPPWQGDLRMALAGSNFAYGPPL